MRPLHVSKIPSGKPPTSWHAQLDCAQVEWQASRDGLARNSGIAAMGDQSKRGSAQMTLLPERKRLREN
jgi:hypothetical protein